MYNGYGPADYSHPRCKECSIYITGRSPSILPAFRSTSLPQPKKGYCQECFEKEKTKLFELIVKGAGIATEKLEEICKAQTLLGVEDLKDLAQVLTGPDNEIWSIQRWKQEVELEQEHAQQMDNFYRNNPPSENTQLENILKEITQDYLAINLENERLRKEKEKLIETIKSLEKLVILPEDVFLVAKINEKKEEITEFKEKLLSSHEITSKELTKLCQLQTELVCLEAKLACEEKMLILERN